MTKCPKCFAVIQGFSRSCVKCGHFLGNPYQWLCPKCGNAVRNEDISCSKCGYVNPELARFVPPSARVSPSTPADPGCEPEGETVELQEAISDEEGISNRGELDWRHSPRGKKVGGVMTWGDSLKIGFGIAMAPFIFAVTIILIVVVAAVLSQVFEIVNQENLGFLMEQLETILEWFGSVAKGQK